MFALYSTFARCARHSLAALDIRSTFTRHSLDIRQLMATLNSGEMSPVAYTSFILSSIEDIAVRSVLKASKRV